MKFVKEVILCLTALAVGFILTHCAYKWKRWELGIKEHRKLDLSTLRIRATTAHKGDKQP